MPSKSPGAETVPDNAWAIEADRNARESGQSIRACRDVVILRWLKKGDVRPLAHLLWSGHRPGPRVLQYLAGRLHPDLAPEYLGYDGQTKVMEYPYRLEVESTTGARGRRDNPENDVRDMLIHEQIKLRRAAGASLEAAQIATAELCGGLSSLEMVRKAYRRHCTGQKRGK
jgi:hypothetical protein